MYLFLYVKILQMKKFILHKKIVKIFKYVINKLNNTQKNKIIT